MLKKTIAAVVIATAGTSIPAVAHAAPTIANIPIPQELEQFIPKATPAPAETIPEKAATAAERKIGSPYVYGATGPNAFDCSGLVQWSYRQAGRAIPRTSYQQQQGGRAVSRSDLKRGDVIIFNGGGHAGIYVGAGRFVHALTEGTPVRRDNLADWQVTAFRRY